MPNASQRKTAEPVAAGATKLLAASPGVYQKAVLRSLAVAPRTLRQLQADVAERVGVSDESPVEAQLDAMVSAGIVEQRAGKFYLSQDGEELAPLVPEPAAT
jgi:hypothetical protein